MGVEPTPTLSQRVMLPLQHIHHIGGQHAPPSSSTSAIRFSNRRNVGVSNPQLMMGDPLAAGMLSSFAYVPRKLQELNPTPKGFSLSRRAGDLFTP